MRIARAALVGLIGVSGLAGRARADDEAVDTSRGADKGALGIGLVLGEPTGVTAKLYLQDDQAIQAAIGSALIGGGLQIHADYVFHPLILQARPAFVMPLYLGPGVRVIDYTAGRGDTGFFAVGL
ncbi:MAG: hypothetical protein NT062_31225, partial [Proteobacteria bacterium]|nr:hypothetical protein [Pseudomonadota bacterium]